MIELFFFVAVIAVAIIINKINVRIDKLEGRLLQLENGGALNKVRETSAPQSVPVVTPEPAATLITKIQETKPALAEESQENKLAEGLLPKIGIVAILFGVGFFLKYAIDQGWIGEWARVIIGLTIGTLFIVLGELWRTRFAKYSQAISGGGAAIVYFSLFAAYSFYGLIDRPVAMILAVIISAIMVALSFRHASMPLALLGAFGAYLSPAVFTSNTDPQIGLLIYLTIVNLAVLAIILKKYWLELSFFSLLGTFFNCVNWFSTKYFSQQNTTVSLIFIVFSLIIFLTGLIIILVKKKQNNEQLKDSEIGLFVILTVIFYGSLTASVTNLNPEKFKNFVLPMFLFGGLMLYLAHALVSRLGLKVANYSLALGGTVLICLGLGDRFDGNMLHLTYLLFGTAMTLIGLLAIKKEEVRFSGIALLVINTILILIRPYDQLGYVFLLNPKFILLAGQTMVMATSAVLYKFVETNENEKSMGGFLTISSSVLFWVAFSLEIMNFFKDSFSSNTQNLSLSIWWIVYATILIGLSAAFRNANLRMVSAAIFTLAILKVFLYDVQTLNTGYKIVSFITLGVILLVISFIYQKRKEGIKSFFENEPKSPTI